MSIQNPLQRENIIHIKDITTDIKNITALVVRVVNWKHEVPDSIPNKNFVKKKRDITTGLKNVIEWSITRVIERYIHHNNVLGKTHVPHRIDKTLSKSL